VSDTTEALRKWREEHPEGAGTPRNPWQKWEDKDTRATAIAAFCWQCVGGSRQDIRDCSCGPDSEGTRCPLYAWRPYK
jgi:hypothetical protein